MKIYSYEFIGIMAIALMLSAPTWRGFTLIPPLDLDLHALPAVLIGIYLGCYKSVGQRLGFNNYFLPLVTFALSVIAIFTLKTTLPKDIHKYLL